MIEKDPAAFHRASAGRFSAVVDRTHGDRWDAPSPVEGWTARDAVRHLVEWSSSFLSEHAGVRLPAGPSVQEDPVAAWHTHADAVQALLEDPATASRTLSDPHAGELPLAQAISMFYTGDVFLHTWDLARATGEDHSLDPDLCAHMLRELEPLDDVLRSSGHYGPRFPVDDDAGVQARLLAFIGRDPGWTPPGAA